MSVKRSLAKQLLKMFFSADRVETLLSTLSGMRDDPGAAPTPDGLVKVLEALPQVRALVRVGVLPLRLPEAGRPGVCVDMDGVLARGGPLSDQLKIHGAWEFIGKK